MGSHNDMRGRPPPCHPSRVSSQTAETNVPASHADHAIANAANSASDSRGIAGCQWKAHLLHRTPSPRPRSPPERRFKLAPFLHIDRSRNRATDAPATCRASDDNLTETAT